MNTILADWLKQRVGWRRVAADVSQRTVPGASVTVYLGGIAAFLFALQIASGVLLILHYQPSAEHAYESVARIAGEYPYGDLVRGVHFWAGHLLVVTLLAQLFLAVVRGTFAPPREFVWLSGLAVATIAIGFAFTGSVLPWTSEAYVQARVGSQMAGYVPLVGHSLLRLLRGGDEITSMTLQHVFGVHIAVLPAIFTATLALHLYLLRCSPERVSSSGAKRIPVFPDFVVRLAAVLVAVLVIVVSLATFVARPVGDAADPTSASPAAARPAWFFLAVHALLRAAPPTLLGVDSARFIGGALTGVFLLLAALPFLDRRGSRVTAGIACALLALAALLTVHALN